MPNDAQPAPAPHAADAKYTACTIKKHMARRFSDKLFLSLPTDMTQRSRTLTRACAAMLLTVFMAYYAIISVYAHVHVVNGVMVVHSHPFKDKHSHPTGQTLVLHYLTHFNSLEAGPAVEIEAPDVKLIHASYSEYVVAHATPDYNSGIYLRAPPVSSFS